MSALDASIASGQAAALLLLRDTASIAHTEVTDDGGGAPHAPTLTTITAPVSVQRLRRGSQELATADRLGLISAALLLFPIGTPIAPRDKVTVSGQVFEAVIALGNTMQLTLTVLADERTGGAVAGVAVGTSAAGSATGFEWPWTYAE